MNLFLMENLYIYIYINYLILDVLISYVASIWYWDSSKIKNMKKHITNLYTHSIVITYHLKRNYAYK